MTGRGLKTQAAVQPDERLNSAAEGLTPVGRGLVLKTSSVKAREGSSPSPSARESDSGIRSQGDCVAVNHAGRVRYPRIPQKSVLVAEWSGRRLQTVARRFESGPGLH